MPTQVRTPDGKIAVFPDGMSDAQIEAVMRREYPPTTAAAPTRSSPIDTAVGYVNRALGEIPFLPELNAGLRAAVATGGQAVGLIPGAPDFGANFHAMRTGDAKSQATFDREHPLLSANAQALGLVAPAAVLGAGQLARSGVREAAALAARPTSRGVVRTAARLAAGGAKSAVGGAAAGAVYGAAQPGTLDERATHGLQGMGPGAVAGAVAPAVLGAGVKALDAGTNAFRAVAGEAPPVSVADGVQGPPPRTPASAGGSGAPPASVASLTPVDQSALTKFVRVAKPDVNAMTGKAAAYSGAGIKPTLVDTTGRRGQAVVRAVASRPTPAQDAVEGFAEQRRVGLASRMSDHARDIVSSDPRTPDDIARDVVQARTEQAQKDFGPIRPQLVKVTPDMANALESPYGRDAIRDAIKRTVDGKERDALQLVYDHINPGQSGMASGSLDGALMTIGQLQDVSKALFDRASASSMPQEQYALTAFGKAIREGAKSQSPDYVDALANFEAASRLAEAPAIGASALSPKGTDTFLSQVHGLGARALDSEDPLAAPDTLGVQLARAGYRRAIETASGGGRPGTAQGVAQTIADAPEMQTKNLALLGPEDAGRLQNAMRLERQAVINAANASPGAGSNTFLNQIAGGAVNGEVSAGEIAKTAGSAAALAHGNPVPGAMQAIASYLQYTRAFSDEEAAALAHLAIDPSRHADALNFIASRAGPEAAEDLAPIMQQAAAEAAAPPAAAVAPAAGAAVNAFAPPPAAVQPQDQQQQQ